MKKLFLLMLTLLASTAIFAQVTTSSISGTVTDQSQQPVIGATVVAKHNPTGTVYATATSRNGMYNLSGMRVGGPYTITISFIGYNDEKFEDVYLTIGEDAQFNAELKEATTAIGEVVVMGSANPVFNSNRTGAQEVISRTMMDKLPTLDRSLNEFVKLTPMSNNKNFAGTSYRFNNVTVDGASFNNSFGLSSALGAVGIEPISLESIEQVQVMIAPYDVRNGGFTGGAINSVTKSGTNEFIGSAYYYHKGASLRGWRQKDLVETVNEAATNQFGFSLGGAIVKNKLFFFVNAEFDRIKDPVTYTTANSRVKAEELNQLKDFLVDKFNYNPGDYNVTDKPTEANRLTTRLDWNINRNNTLSLKYYFLNSYATNSPSTSGAPKNGRGPNEWALPFSSQYYRTHNDFHIVMADLNTTINERMSNTLTVGYSRLRDYRDMDGGYFPHVDILDNATDKISYTSFGTEANSYGNKLDTDIFQIQDNFTINAGKHQIVIGTQSDYRAFTNGYAYGFAGVWRYNSLDDFYTDANAYLNWKQNGGTRPTTNAASFSQKYAIGGGFPEAQVKVLQLGFYLQDKWSIRKNLKLTYGVRVDVPIFLNKLDPNTEVEGMTFQGGIKNVDLSKLPKTKPMFSPRIGFNWDVLPSHKLQVRGGTGLFTGTPPYVWISNQAGNNGLMFGDLSKGRPFDGMAQYQPTPDDIASSTLDLAYTQEGFKYPQLWKTNVAVDFKFGNGWILTGEALYTKDVNAIYHANVGLNDRVAYVNDGDGQTRPYYSKVVNNKTTPFINARNSNVIEMRNTSKGYSIFGTLQLQKQFLQGALRGLYLNASYTMGKAMGVADGSSSVASSAWKYRPAIDCNAPELSLTSGSFDGRLLISAFYTANWSKNAATNFGLVYEMYRPWRYSFTYNGDVNGDGQYANDLIYIPRNKNEIQLEAGSYADVDAAWTALDAFIGQDDYLSKHRGEYAERNGSVLPFEHQLDLSISQDIKIWCNKGKKCNTLRFSFDISNFLNLLNKNWGVKNDTWLGHSGSPQYQFLTMKTAPSASNNYTPTFVFQKDLTETYKDLRSGTSRWAIMFGVKYMFN